MIVGVLLASAFGCFALAAVFSRGENGPRTVRRLMAAGIVLVASAVVVGIAGAAR
jgi:hypothetical protein